MQNFELIFHKNELTARKIAKKYILLSYLTFRNAKCQLVPTSSSLTRDRLEDSHYSRVIIVCYHFTIVIANSVRRKKCVFTQAAQKISVLLSSKYLIANWIVK